MLTRRRRRRSSGRAEETLNPRLRRGAERLTGFPVPSEDTGRYSSRLNMGDHFGKSRFTGHPQSPSVAADSPAHRCVMWPWLTGKRDGAGRAQPRQKE